MVLFQNQLLWIQMVKSSIMVMQSPLFIDTKNTKYNELLDIFIGSPLLAIATEDYKLIKHYLLDSDHSPIQLDLSFGAKIKSKLTKKISIRNYNKANWKQFYKNLNLINNNKYNDLNLID